MTWLLLVAIAAACEWSGDAGPAALRGALGPDVSHTGRGPVRVEIRPSEVGFLVRQDDGQVAVVRSEAAVPLWTVTPLHDTNPLRAWTDPVHVAPAADGVVITYPEFAAGRTLPCDALTLTYAGLRAPVRQAILREPTALSASPGAPAESAPLEGQVEVLAERDAYAEVRLRSGGWTTTGWVPAASFREPGGEDEALFGRIGGAERPSRRIGAELTCTAALPFTSRDGAVLGEILPGTSIIFEGRPWGMVIWPVEPRAFDVTGETWLATPDALNAADCADRRPRTQSAIAMASLVRETGPRMSPLAPGFVLGARTTRFDARVHDSVVTAIAAPGTNGSLSEWLVRLDAVADGGAVKRSKARAEGEVRVSCADLVAPDTLGCLVSFPGGVFAVGLRGPGRSARSASRRLLSTDVDYFSLLDFTAPAAP